MTRPTNLKAGDQFRVIEGDSNFRTREIITLDDDDGTSSPFFLKEDNSNFWRINFSHLEPYAKTTKPKGRKDKMKNKQKDYTSQAIFAIVAYLVFLTYAVYAVQLGLWQAVDANFEYSESQHKTSKLPCSSSINENCEIYIKQFLQAG